MSGDLGTVNGPEAAGSRTQQMIDALRDGASLSTGDDNPTVEEPVAEEPAAELNAEEPAVEVESEVDISVSTEEDNAESIEEPSTEEEVDLAEEEPASSEPLPSIQEIQVTDAKGRRKVKVDFSDKDKLTKYVQLAYGARKWQKERDDFKVQLDEKTALWDDFENAWKGGIKGLVNKLEGSEDAFDKLVDSEIQKRQELASLGPEELKARELDEKYRRQQLEAEKIKSDYQKKLEAIEAKEQAAEQAALESRIHPSFERYRFTGKLGDEVAEHEFDTMLWDRTIQRLEKLPEDKEITKAVIDKEFRSVSQMMRKHFSAQAEKTVKKSLETKKKAAATKVQAAARKGVQQNKDVDDIRNEVRSGNMIDGLANFFKSGGKL